MIYNPTRDLWVNSLHPKQMVWEILPFDFNLGWIYDSEYGWLQVCFLPETHQS